MERILLFSFLFMVAASGLQAQMEIEPNNSFTTANQILQGSTVTGDIGTLDALDYFVSLPGDDGTIVLTYTYTNTSGFTTSDFFINVYSQSQSSLGSKANVNVPTNVKLFDTLRLYCHARDSIFIRINSTGAFDYTFEYTKPSIATNDPEPNNDFISASQFSVAQTVTGRIGYTASGLTDGNDYYYSVLPEDGTIQIIWDQNNTSNTATSDIWLTIYNKAQSNIGSNAQANQPIGLNGPDTLYIFCRKADTVFFRINSTGCFTYNLRYSMLSIAPPDPEPNDDFASAVQFNAKDTVRGRIGHTSVSTDGNDYYYSALPEDGTMQIIWDQNNTSNTATSDIWLTIYNKAQSNIGSNAQANQPIGLNGPDTLYIFCRKADTVFFRINSTGCFTYNLRYSMLPIAPPDPEPNDDFASAVQFNAKDTVRGRIGHTSVSTDGNDYYFSALPEDGTMQIIWDQNNTSNTATSDIWLTIYNKAQSNIGSNAQVNQPIGLNGPDTLYIFCRKADTVFFRINSTGCFTYNLRYSMLPIAPPDPEPNDDFASAVQFNAKDTVRGRIGHTSVSTDGNDYYYSALPEDGTMQIIWDQNNTSNTATSDIWLTIYNKAQSNIGSNAQVNQPIGLNGPDTLYIFCRKADTVFFRINSTGCFTYNLRYDLLQSSSLELEPNNSFDESQLISSTDSIVGNVGYRSVRVDGNDYFKLFNLKKLSIKVFLEANNTSNTSGSDFYINLYNTSRGRIDGESYPNHPVGPWKDTLEFNCLPEDTLFFRVNSTGCFSYKMRLELVEEEPTAEFSIVRFGNEISLVPTIRNADGFEWDLGDGTKSNKTYPQKTYLAGNFNITLTGLDTTCGFDAITTRSISIAGIEDYTPKESGSGGDMIMDIYGAGFSMETKVTLKQGGTSLTPYLIDTTGSKSTMRAVFDLHTAIPGLYDLIISIPGEPDFLYRDGFEISDLIYPSCEAEVVGPDQIRPTRWATYELVVSNPGNIMASGVPVWLLVPDDFEIELDHKEDFTDFLDTITHVGDGGVITKVPLDYIQEVLDSMRIPFFHIDTFREEAFAANAYSFLIPYILPGDVAIIRFKAKTDVRSQTNNFIAWAEEVNFWGSGALPQTRARLEGQVADRGVDYMIDGLDLFAENTKNKPLQAFTKTVKIGKGHVGLFGQFVGYWSVDGVSAGQAFSQAYGGGALDKANVAAASATAECIGDKAISKLNIKSGTAAQKNYRKDMGHRARRMMREKNPILKNLDRQQILKLMDKNTSQQEMKALMDVAWKTTKDLKKLEGETQKFLAELEAIKKDCPELAEQLGLPEDKKDFAKNDKNKKKEFEVLNSRDPNAIYGPQGY